MTLTTEITRLLGAIDADDEFQRQIAEARTLEERAKIAQERGFNISVDNIRNMREAQERSQAEGELGEAELAHVAGGGKLLEYAEGTYEFGKWVATAAWRKLTH